jgi:flagellar assembly protein FliH
MAEPILSKDDDPIADGALLKSVHFSEVGPERRMPSWLAPPPKKGPAPKRKATPAPARTVREAQPPIEESVPPQPEESVPPSREFAQRSVAPRAPERPSIRALELEALQGERSTLRETIERVEADLGAALEQFVQARAEIEQRCAEEMVDLVGVIARRVVGREVKSDPSFVVNLVREALRVLSQNDSVLVRLGPALSETQRTLIDQFSGSGITLKCELDTTLAPYGCVVETDLGRVDESVETRLKTLLEAAGLSDEEEG